jgi:hypothetical protein
MIISKAQGQSLKAVGIDLKCFSHTWLAQKLVLQKAYTHVACSEVGSAEGLHTRGLLRSWFCRRLTHTWLAQKLVLQKAYTHVACTEVGSAEGLHTLAAPTGKKKPV